MLVDLFRWHKVNPNLENRWSALAIALAEAHVPGMRIIHEPMPKRGRKISWKAGLGTELLRDVERLQAENSDLTFDAAIKKLRQVKGGRWEKYEGRLRRDHGHRCQTPA